MQRIPERAVDQLHPRELGRRQDAGAQLSTITLFDGPATANFDGLPASAFRWL